MNPSTADAALSPSDPPVAALEPPPRWAPDAASPHGPGSHPAADPEPLVARVAELEQQLDTVRRELAHAHRLTTLGTLASSVAHEQNNLLTPVISYAQLALKSPDKPELMRKAVQKALSGTQAAAHISASLLGFAAEGQGGSAAELRPTVEAALQCLPRDPQKDGITLSLDLPDAVAAIPPLHLQQVVVNLALNAKKAMRPAGGQLTLRGELWRDDRGRGVRLVVADTGPGIPESIRDRLFEPFVTGADTAEQGGESKNAAAGDEKEGTGLGLSICRDLAEQAGGHLHFESTPGQGTRFLLDLPLADEK